MEPAGHQGERHVGPDLLVAEELEPAPHGLEATRAPRIAAGDPADDEGRPSDLVRGQPMPYGGADVSFVFEPGSGGRVEPRDLGGSPARELRLEVLGEEVVVAIPLVALVERPDEEVLAGQIAQHLAGVIAPGHHAAEVGAKPLEDRGLEQKTAQVGGLLLEDLARQILPHLGPVAAQLRGARESGQIQTGGPTLGRREQVVELAFAGGPAVHGQQPGRLVAAEGELGEAQLVQPPERAQAGERNLGVAARADHDARAPRQRLEEHLEEPPAVLANEAVSVVEDEHERRRGGDRRAERRQDGLADGGPGSRSHSSTSGSTSATRVRARAT